MLLFAGPSMAVHGMEEGAASDTGISSGPQLQQAVDVLGKEGTGTNTVVDMKKVLELSRGAARHTPSLFLSEAQKVEATESFVKLVGIRSGSEEEKAIQEDLKRRFSALGGQEIPYRHTGTNVPLNLVMEFAATPGFKERPALILNAHVDTIEVGRRCTPERMDFNVASREFFHQTEGSFGGDDKAGVTVIMEALKAAKEAAWDKGREHRRVLVILTAQEENGEVGAEHLAIGHTNLFENIEISITCAGPINEESPYPAVSFVVVAHEQKRNTSPYRDIIQLVQEVSDLKRTSFFMTTLGLGMGDFAFFPPQARSADLHIRSPYQGDHKEEKVKLDDLFNHIDLFTYIILRLDGIDISPRDLRHTSDAVPADGRSGTNSMTVDSQGETTGAGQVLPSIVYSP